MADLLVYFTAITFAISVFPVHIINYVYVNTDGRYASLNIGIYKLNLFNANTVKDHPDEMQINGKNKKFNIKSLKINYYKFFNMLCIYKFVQLGDFGMQNSDNAYKALAQYSFTTAIYKFLQINGNYSKLRNYIVFNDEHSYIRYYAKAELIINLIVLSKILMIYFWEKIK